MTARSTSRSRPAASWRLWTTLVVVAFASGHAPAIGSESSTAHEHYRVLAWNELVAEGWEKPLLLSSDAVGAARVDESSLVPELDQRLVALPGYMRPVVREGKHATVHEHEHLSGGQRVTEFLLVPFLPQHPCQHSLWDPNQVVHVNLVEPMQVNDPENPIWVVGTITLDTVETDDGPAAYRIVEAVTTRYEY